MPTKGGKWFNMKYMHYIMSTSTNIDHGIRNQQVSLNSLDTTYSMILTRTAQEVQSTIFIE